MKTFELIMRDILYILGMNIGLLIGMMIYFFLSKKPIENDTIFLIMFGSTYGWCACLRNHKNLLFRWRDDNCI